MPSRTLPDRDISLQMDSTLSIINHPPTQLDGPELLHELISGPETDAVALEFLDADGQRSFLSYSDLHEESDRLASRLERTGFQVLQDTPNIIPLYIPQCPSLYISQLAILKSGAAFCPLNLDVPEERLRFILKDTSARVLLTTSSMVSHLPELDGISVITVDEDFSNIKHKSHTLPLSGRDKVGRGQPSLAYIMYTSGSTGLPKAVCLSHRAVTQSLLAHDRYIPTFSRFLQFASPTFDVSVFEIFFPWYRGATLVSCERGRLLGDLPGTITALGIDAAELTPSVAASLVRTRDSVPTLKTLLTIGEMLNAQVIKQFGTSKDQAGILHGMYGPTEAAIHCTLQPKFDTDLPAGTIGVPLDTVSCFIVRPAESNDQASHIDVLPIGEIGELVVGGHQLADGYLNRDEQTRAAFVTHPKFGGLYRTGDKARLLPDGRIECHGRISSGQVKLRGQRVELGEIEHAASKVAGCHAVVSSVISGLLVVFCIVESGTVTPADIKAACRKWLPSYMIPGEVVLMDDFPYLPSGKTDKKKLESDYKAQAEETAADVGNFSDLAKSITRTVQAMLHVTINPSTDLGMAGLDSLKAIQLASELRRQGYDGISALALLAAHSVLDIEAVLQAKSSVKPSEQEKSIFQSSWQDILVQSRSRVLEVSETRALEADLEDVLPCTPLQDAMLSETARQPQAYCNSLRLSFPVDTSSKHLWTVLEALAKKHLSLRSGFCASGLSHSAYSQIVWKSLSPSQFTSVEKFDENFCLDNDEMYLRPLRFQCRQLGESVELLLHIHHALYDQWSIEIILEDLDSLLRQSELPSRTPFTAVNEFYCRNRSSDKLGHEDFWQEYLSGVTPGRLPQLSSRVEPSKSLQSIESFIQLDMSMMEEAARKHSCSTHVFFQATYAILLGLYMGLTDVTFGTVFSGRTLPIAGIEDIVGPILSTLPSRIDVTEGKTFADILRRLQYDNREIMQNSTVPLAEIKKACGVSPGEALFDSIFVWQQTARDSSERALLVKLEEARDYLEFNLTLELEPVDEGVKAKATFQPSILPEQQVEIFLQQLGELVKLAAAEPATPMAELTDKLPATLLSITNPQPRNFEYQVGLGSVVETHASNSPHKTALIFAHYTRNDLFSVESLTYAELNNRANKLAHLLIAKGVKSDELVCVCMEKSIDLYVAILAIVKAGAGYLPLVPETPISRIKQIICDADVKICLTDLGTTKMIADLQSCYVLDVASTDTSSQPGINPVAPFNPTNIAYAVFTSGTTGKPKGVLVTQENILSNLEVLSTIYPVPEGSRLLQACNQAFDVSVFEIFFTWYTGMSLCSASKDVLFRNFEDSINQLEITHLSLTPTVAALANPTHIPKVKFLVTAGEAVTHQVHGAWAGKGLYQGYGPSETTNICTVNPVVEHNHAINNIGPPFENTSAFVLEQGSGFKVLPFGSLGELCFGGQQVFRGYQNMPELTKSKIVEHADFGRIYRSGDLGRLLPDGTILIQGRTDEQRKIRGQRIELGEVSSCLLRSSGVRDCAVDIIKSENQQERLLAFWIPSGNSDGSFSVLTPDQKIRSTIDSLFISLVDQLPVYMVPDALIAVTAIPMTLQGKIDRRRLAAVALEFSTEQISVFSQSLDTESETTDVSDTDKKLMSALAEVLQTRVEAIGRSMSFFALGLDSVSAIRFATRLRTQYGYRVDVSQILKRPSVARLSSFIDQDSSHTIEVIGNNQQSDSKTLLNLDIRQSISDQFRKQGKTVESVLPCTPLQEAMLSAGFDSASSSAYRNKTLFRIGGDILRLQKCWEMMIQRHEILRTAFYTTEQARFPFVQVVLSGLSLPWKQYNSDLQDPLSLLKSSETPKPTSLEMEAPPWEIQLYTLGAGTYMLLDMHHALYDAIAMENLLLEVETAYRDQPLDEPSSLAPFLDYMVSSDLDEADLYYAEHLRSYTPKPFSRISSNEAAYGYGTMTADVRLPVDQVDSYLKKHSLTMLGLAQAVWAKVLSSAQTHADICFGNVVSGRTVPVEGVQSLVAPCFNTLPVRVNLSKHRSNISLIKALQKTNVDALPFQLTPLRRLQAASTARGQRLFDSMVLLQQAAAPRDSDLWHLEGETGEMNFPFIMEVVPNRDAFGISLHFDRSYFEDDLVYNLHRACISAFISCVKYPLSDVSDFEDFDIQSISGSLKPDGSSSQAAEQSSSNDQPGQSSADEHWSPMELQIRSAFSAISSTAEERITKATTIYRLGLDSISAIQVANRLRKSGFTLQASDVMESPTCSELASVIQSRSQTPQHSTPGFDLESFDRHRRSNVLASINVQSSQITGVRPCTPVQSGMLSQYLHSEGHQYLNHTFYSLDDEYQEGQLEQAWACVIAQHEMLRTGFATTDDNDHPFVMVVYKGMESPQESPRLSIKSSGSTFGDHEQAANAAIYGRLHLPPWKWDVFRFDDKWCLQFSAHHALFDAESLRMIMSDLRAALTDDDTSPRKGIDSALSSILTNINADRDEQRSFWSRQLEGIPVTPFPSMAPLRVTEQETIVLQHTLSIPRQEIESRCQKLGVSMQSIGQAAWAKLLSAYTGESQVTFGVVYSGRTTSETADAPFPCITTLPVRSDVSANDSQLLQDLMSYNAGIQKHQFTPLTDIQKYADLPNQALFDTLFAYQRPLSEDVSAFPWDVVHEKASVELAVSIEMEALTEDYLGFRLTVNSDQIPLGQGKIMLRQLEEIFLGLVGLKDSMDESILAIIPPKKPAVETEFQFMHQVVEGTVDTHPEKIALEFVTDIDNGDVTSRFWTYRQFDEEANKIAHLLAQRGVKPGGVVATSFDKCPEASFAFLGILKAGCAFCAIDPTAPTARKAFILQDSSASVMLTTGSIRAELQGSSECEIVDLLNLDENESVSVERLEISGLTPSSVSYVLYTSGTTGTPKGCELTHENSVQLLLTFQHLFEGRWTDESRWLQFASYHFDVSVVEQFWTWSVGMRLVCAPRDLILEDIMGMIDTMKITHLDLTPSLGRLLDPSMVPSLHNGVFITGGESLKQDMVNTWGEIGCLFNFYGPTECTIGVTVFPSVPTKGKPSNIGWQFDVVGTYVLNPRSQQPVIRGAVGELCISGKLVGKGYLNRPELTHDCFPHLDQYGERVYRTGDLVRLLHDGTFDFLGRKDNQVKLRGQRLEIDEIEAVVRRCPDIQDVICIVAKHPKQQKEQLIGFIAMSSNRRQGSPQLCEATATKDLVAMARTACESQLPGYMVPTHFLPIQHIPLSVNNKIEEKMLRKLYADMSSNEVQEYSMVSQSQEALNNTEERIAQILAELLKIDAADMNPGSNIFALGLNSISAIQFSRKLKSSGFANAQVAVVLRNSTISRLAKSISASSKQHTGDVTAANQTISACRQRYLGLATQVLDCKLDEIEAIAPCTPLQQGIISRSLASDSSLYFNTFRYQLHDADLPKLRSNFQEAVTRTQILRTSFIETDDGHVQVVRKSCKLHWSHLQTESSASTEKISKQRKIDWCSSNEPHLTKPLEIIVIESPCGAELVLHIHHSLYDGNSFEMLIRNVSKLYQGDKADFGKPFISALPYGPLRHVSGSKDFWLEHMKEARTTHIPALVEGGTGSDVLSSHTFDISREANELSRSLGVTLQAVLQACWAVTLRKYHQGPIGAVVSGRSIDFEGSEAVIGPLFNTIPFNPNLDSGSSWQSLIEQCHEFNTSVLPYQHTSLRDIMKWCNKNRSEPLFDTLFVFQGLIEDTQGEASIFVPRHDSQFEADYPLSFEAEEQVDGKLNVTIAAKSSICDAVKAEQLASEFYKMFLAMSRNLDQAIGSTVDYDFVSSHQSAKETTNGYHTDERHDFEWTTEARSLRTEIATLAAVDESEIDGQTSVFEVGLDSVDAVKLSSRLKKKGFSLAVSTIMQLQTIEKMTGALSATTKDDSKKQYGNAFSALQKKLIGYVQAHYKNNGFESVLPASPMQEALITEMISSSYRAYYNHDVLQVPGSVDLRRLEKAWKAVIMGSPILRTGFLQVEDPDLDVTFIQVVHRFTSFACDTVDLPSSNAVTGQLEKIRDAISTTPLLEPQMRLTLATTPGGQYLIISLPHALYDGHSLSLLHQDVYRAYNDRYSSRPFYEEVLRDTFSTSNDEAVTFWRSLLSGATKTHLSQLIVPENVKAVTHRTERRSKVPVEALISFSRQQGVTLQAVCQTAWAFVLAHHVQALDVMFGVVLAGRDTELAEEVMFPMMNTVAMRSVLHGSRREVMVNIQATIANITHHQHFPLRQIQAACQNDVRASANNSQDGGGNTKHDNFFDTLFTYQKRPEVEDYQEAELYHSVNGASDVEYSIAAEAEVVHGKLIWRIACKSTVFDFEGVEKILETLDQVLGEIVSHPEEASLSFQDKTVSICGLPSFQRSDEVSMNEVPHTSKSEEEDNDTWSELEITIRDVISKVTKTSEDEMSRNGALPNFGVDSINAIKISALLRKQSIRFTVSNIVRAGSIAKIAATISEKVEASASVKGSSEDSIARLLSQKNLTAERFGYDTQALESILPATSGQTYMLCAWEGTAGRIFYGDFKYQVQVPTTMEAIRVAWTKSVSSNSSLRTVFVATGDVDVPFLQLVLRSPPPSFVDMTHDKETSLQEPTQPYVGLSVSEGTAGFELRLKIHHALYDAVSLPLLIQELSNNLQGITTPTPAIKFDDFLSLNLDKSTQDKCKAFWTNYLRDTTSPKLSAPSKPALVNHIETYDPHAMLADSQAEIRLRKQGLSIQALFFAAYAKVYLSKLHASVSQDVIMGIYLANRSHLNELSSLASPTLNIVPLRVRSPTQTPLLELAKQVQSDLQIIGSPENSSVGLWEIQKWTNVTIDTFVNFVKLPDSSEEEERSSVIVDDVSSEEQRTSKRSLVTEPDGSEFVLPDELKNNPVSKTCGRSLDIEATVSNGQLGIGVFGWDDMTNPLQAESLAEGIVQEIKEILE